MVIKDIKDIKDNKEIGELLDLVVEFENLYEGIVETFFDITTIIFEKKNNE